MPLSYLKAQIRQHRLCPACPICPIRKADVIKCYRFIEGYAALVPLMVKAMVRITVKKALAIMLAAAAANRALCLCVIESPSIYNAVVVAALSTKPFCKVKKIAYRI